jgi:monovalent cation:H+ antiporter, CPA1 family
MPDIHVLTLLLLAACVVGVIARRLHFPYAVALVVVGFAIGLTHAFPQVRLDPRTLLFIMLPPLLFEAGLNLRIELLRRGALPIALLSVAGTILSAAGIAAATHWLVGLPWNLAMIFGALISATDPVSVVAVFHRTPADPLLITVVEAESLFNDSVAVVLFGIASTMLNWPEGLWQGGGQFCLLMGGGIVFGVAVGYLASLFTRPVEDHLIETLITCVAAYGSYLAAEVVGVSGVVAVTCAAIVIGSFGFDTSMSARTRESVSNFWEFGGFLVNSVVFLLVGIEATHGGLRGLVGPILLAYLIVLGVRALMCYGFGAALHRRRAPVPWAWRHLLVWAGLRGGLGMALALSVAPDLPGRATLVALTFGVVLLSLVIQGSTSHAVVERLVARDEGRCGEAVRGGDAQRLG